ncbi:hypothetical protein IMG5_090120, partial [Ichthyophthirius multifiliis]
MNIKQIKYNKKNKIITQKNDYLTIIIKINIINRSQSKKNILIYIFINYFFFKKKDSFLNKVHRRFFGPKIQQTPRKIYLNGLVSPQNYFQNIVKNQKYSIFTFVFIVLFNEFKYFFNLFFLIIAISQFVPILKVGLLFAYVAPLSLVLCLTMLKEAYDDIKRYKRDKEANSQLYKVLEIKEEQQFIKSSDLKVGNIIKVEAGQRIPADLILLSSADNSGDVFIKTDQLDGETDWKLRKPVHLINQKVIQQGIDCILNINGYFEIQKPIENIYQFIGVLNLTNEDNQQVKESISLEQTMWSSTVLASGQIYGLVIFTGNETRMAMNSRETRSKFGQLDCELNYLSKLLFVFMIISSLVLVILNGVKLESYTLILFFRYVLLLSSIIPISMRVNLDFAKLIYCYKINVDKEIEGTVARSSQIPEELGRIQFLLTDKTGTLTQNDMIFKKLQLEQGVFTYEEIEDLKQIVRSQCQKSLGPMVDVEQYYLKMENESQNIINSNNKHKHIRNIRRDKNQIIRDLVTALAVCHNVTPIIEEGKPKQLQSSSPDEVALVQIAEDIGFILQKRSQQSIQIQNGNNEIENYQILNIFPFSSENKKMGIIVKQLETNRYIFYLKGADTVMKNKIPEYQRGFLLDACENLAREGLRTLIITQKYLTQNQYEEWANRYFQANTQLQNREEKKKEVLQSIEKNMEFLGITGVEDKLQDEVCQTLESLRNAGISIWMLTGDKLETAICIAISAGLKSNQQYEYIIKEAEDPYNLQYELQRFSHSNNSILIIDGISLKLALDNHEKLFFEISTKASTVICCRCSPTQKSQITLAIKKYTGKKTAGIGDGGNDVGMIQSADVGIGIVGKEGTQAALAADFSIKKFKNLNRLLLWHGRLSYKRSSALSQFVIHRGLIISIIQAIFIVCFFFVPIPVYNGYLILGYSTVFTMFPVFSIVFDEDVDELTAINYPPLYKSLQKNRELNTKTFIGWLWVSIYQGTIIMILSFYIFKNAFISIQTITYAALIVSEILNILFSINKIHIIMIISMLCSILIYALSCFLLKNYIDISEIDFQFFQYLFYVTLASWCPPFFFSFIKKRVDPSDYEKV